MADTPRDTHSSEASDPLESLVAEILDLPEDDQPRAFAELRSRFPEHEELLVRWEGAAQAIAPGPTVADAESGARDTTVDALRDGIAGYQILEVLGEGGMGTVYLAEQSEPVQRRVALKVIKLGMDGGRVLARFELERRALARMTHDCIARVFDAGTTTSGQPFFVMEYVAGVPLVEHCDTRSLPLEDRVELFRRVCAGVQHAHNKGVIHRDLKPANILVVSDGGQATPKIIDFGLARATDRALVQRASSTLMGCVLGTPEYMSPEQATADTDVDTRTDVYSLGVILYELLTGELPLLDLRRAGWREIQRVLRDVEPPRPSTRVSTASERGTEIAQRRGTRADSLARRLRGDLDWIVVKALSKDPNRRYESAAELSMDLQRYLAGQPVHAVPPTVRYHATKFVQRHRVQVAAALVLLIVLLSAGIASTAFYLQATKDSREKQRQSRVARDEATETRRQQDIAQQHLDRFQRLATAVRLAEARRDVSSLQPAWPESVSALQSWLDDSGDPLVAQLPVIEATLRDLEADAVPVSATQRQADRESDPRYGSYMEWAGRLRSMERANEVRRGARQAERVAVPEDAPEDAAALLRLACSKYGYVCVEFGEEALGLALARRALERAEPIMRFEYYDGLAWALFHNGLDQEALEVSAKGVAAAPAFLKQHWATRDARLQKAVADPEAHLDRCRNMVTQLDRAIERARTLRFANPADAFLDQTMRELRTELVRFASPDGTLAEVRRRLRWAKTIETLTTEHPRAKVTWDQARQAIERADGVVASTRYARHPVALRPQTGLVPIGMNPITKLWEFYHLRSAWDPAADTDPASLRIPVHREDGTVDGDGVVFVLIPGGSFMMGAQRSDRGGPNYFRHADPHEFPVHDVELAPFFLARHEVTQGQWIRLSGADNPSALQPDAMLTTGERITTSHPVENVSWDMCRTLLETHGLDLPTEAQWEYAARAGTTTLWFTGDDPSQLAGFANVFDQTGQRLIPSSTIRPAAFDDGYAGSSPVGTHRANAFGMHDMHGNKWEWCRELRATYFQPVAPGDGERSFGVGGDRVCRGGSCRTMIQSTRASIRNAESPTHRNSDIGVRAARRIRD